MSTYSLPLAIIWILLGVGLYGFELLGTIVGIASGVLIGTISSWWILMKIEHDGQYQQSRVSPVVLVILMLTVLSIYYVSSFTVNTALLQVMTELIFSFIPGLILAQAVLFLSWEMRRGVQIVAKGRWFPTLYAVNKNSAC